MKTEVSEFLSKIESAPILRKIGAQIDDDRVVMCSGWDEATDVPLLEYFCDVQLQLGNEIAKTIPNDIWCQICDSWNPLVAQIRPRVRGIQDLVENFFPSKDESVRWVKGSLSSGIVYTCLEIEFQEYTKSTFFRESAKWYLQGHLPCGWSDDFPAGKLVVF